MQLLHLTCSGTSIAIEELSSSIAGTIQPHADEHRLHLGKHVESATTSFRVAAATNDHTVWQLVLSTDDGPSTVHPHMALCHGQRLLLGIGPHVVCLNTATGDPRWTQRADSATVFGIHPILGEHAVLIHGEMEITKLSLDGTILWQAGGRDIFIGEVILKVSHVEVTDFNGDIYAIRLDTGVSTIIGHGKSPY